MTKIPDLAAVAGLIADPTRAAMLFALMDGMELSAGELAVRAKISPQTASSHLAKLVNGGLLSVVTDGRHRYFRLKNKQVAQALETLSLLAPPMRVRSLNHSLEMQAVRRARTCYDHFAGVFGVTLTEQLVARHLLAPNNDRYEVTRRGQCWFEELGVDLALLQTTRRAYASMCLDWSERKPHLSGALGAAVAERFFARRWVKRVDASRAVKVTEAGKSGLKQALGMELAFELEGDKIRNIYNVRNPEKLRTLDRE
jgi:DNA-binding transcriptional ArsR family regulator